MSEGQGSYSLKVFLDRTEGENSENNAFGSRSYSTSTNTGSSKANRSLLNDPRIKEIRTLLCKLRIEHPKLKCLIEILKEKMLWHPLSSSSSVIPIDNASSNIAAKDNHFARAIVFTQYRDTAQHIVDILSSNGIKASRFVGQAKKEGDKGMKQEEQAQALESFRRGEFSVLVATSIAEEGLDIPEVDLVIFFEPIPSEIRYIQRKGRTGRRSSGSVIILAAKDTIDERHLNASKRRIEKMNQTLSTIESALKSVNRTARSTPVLDIMTNEEIYSMEVNRAKSQLKMGSEIQGTSSTLTKGVSKWVSSLDGDYTIQFVRDVNNAARKIHSLLVKKRRSGEDVDIIRDTLGFDNNVLVEALKKLEKLKRIKWLDDVTIALSDNLKRIPGEVHDIYIENILSGITLVMIDGKWHARLNHYDYEGPRYLLKKGSEFKAISELYHDGKAFCVRIKQIV